MGDQKQHIELVADNSDDEENENEELLSDYGQNKNNKNKLVKTPQELQGLSGGGGNVDIIHPLNDSDLGGEYSVDEAISLIGTGCFQFKLILITGLLWSTEAIEMIIITILQPVIIEIWELDELRKGTLALCVYGGMLFGTFLLGTISDRIGRRLIVIIACIGYALFSLLSAFSVNYEMLLITRFIVGFFIGGAAVAFTLFAEFSPTKKRGRMLVIQQGFFCFGALFSSLLGFVSMEYLNWRYYLMFSSIPIWCISLFAGWIPESPHYLMATGKYDECKETLQRVADSNGTAVPSGYLRSSMSLNQKRGRLADVFSKTYRKTSILTYTMLITSVFSYFGLSFIGQRIFIDDDGDQYEDNLFSVLGEIPPIIIGYLVIDKIGRKPLLNICFMIYSIACFLLCFSAIRQVSLFGVILIFIGRMFTSLAFMTQYIYFSEYYPTTIRATALGGASSLDEISKILADYLAQDITNIGQGMIIFGIVGLVSLICSFFIDETLGKELNAAVDYGSNMKLHQNIQMKVALDMNDNKDIDINKEQQQKLQNGKH